MSYLEVFGVLTGVGADVSKFFGVGAGVLKRGAGAESESEKCDSAHLWFAHSTSTNIGQSLNKQKPPSVWPWRAICNTISNQTNPWALWNVPMGCTLDTPGTNDTVCWARRSEAIRPGAIPSPVLPNTWTMIFASFSPASCSWDAGEGQHSLRY